MASRAPRRHRAARQRYSGARAPRDPRIRNQRLHARRGRHADQRARRGRAGQEELYIVLDGKATFEIDGEAVDAPAGTLVFVGPESRRKATGEGTVLAVGATPGEAYQGIDWGEAWPFHNESMKAYGEQRYADALEAVRSALEHMPDHAGLQLQLRVLRNTRGRHRRRDVLPPPTGRRAASAVPRGRAQRRRLRRRAQRPAVRGGSSLTERSSLPS